MKYLILFIFISLNSFSLRFPPAGGSSKGYRIIFGPSLGFYTINTNHARFSSPKMSALIGFRKEIRLDRQFRTFFLVGADYFFHGLNFKSYYFKQDSLKLYDKSFDHNYSLFIQEVHIPLQIKYSFNNQNNSLFSPYAMIGYHVRMLLPAEVTVSQNGNTEIKKWEDLSFKNSLFGDKVNSFLSASVGWQKNTVNHSKVGFFVEVNYRYGFSQYYISTNYTASSLYINGSHLGFFLGLNF